jgi:hypothetical protein
MYKNLLKVVLCLTISLNSCVNTIEFKGRETKPLLVLNCLVQADSVIKADISRSVFFMDNYSEQNTFVTDADIEVFVNGNSIGKMQFVANRHMDYYGNYGVSSYSINYKAKKGDKIRVNVSAANFDKIWAETIVPEYATEISDIEQTTEINEYGALVPAYHIKFKDNPNEKNYYLLTAVKIYPEQVTGAYDTIIDISDYPLSSTDVIFGQIGSIDNIFGGSDYRMFNIFSDDLINGQEYSLVVTADYYFSSLVVSITFKLHSITKEYYLYLQTISASYNDFLGVFGEPVQIFNNINGGIGILGGSAIGEKSILDMSNR